MSFSKVLEAVPLYNDFYAITSCSADNNDIAFEVLSTAKVISTTFSCSAEVCVSFSLRDGGRERFCGNWGGYGLPGEQDDL